MFRKDSISSQILKFSLSTMGNKDRVITGIFRMLTFPICIALAIYVVPLFDDLRKYPLPLDIPNRHEIYTGQGLTAAFVREILLKFYS